MLIGQPQTYTDAKGSWTSSIFRTPVAGPLLLTERGLDGDAVADTDNHGSPDQAVCCHPIAHYAAWGAEYDLAASALGPGSVGENWTLTELTEADVCVGDTFAVGEAVVQVTGPRYPCTKQERKLGLPGWHRRTMETGRTGFYLRVLAPGMVRAKQTLALLERPLPAITVAAVNRAGVQGFDESFARMALELPELGSGWKKIFGYLLEKRGAL